ncbi:MAG TPA: hypothetical protein VGR35_18920 [Tepidisphaeraceae bacterium]|nr:hypothetical protein [Tepidisphaeraceae bacterium]
MRITSLAIAAVALFACCTWISRAGGQTTRPAAAPDRAEAIPAGAGATTRPTGKSAEEMLNQLLKPTSDARPLQPTSAVQSGGADATSGAAAVAPGAPVVNVMREGTDIVNRVGRLTRSADGEQWEFTFESDGRTLLDPPVIVLPNLTLMLMESNVTGSSRDLRFRITGEVTEYRGRNYILLRKASVVSDAVKQF